VILTVLAALNLVGLDKPAPQQNEYGCMSDAELVNELAKQANELGLLPLRMAA
jgi:hypothetical protein